MSFARRPLRRAAAIFCALLLTAVVALQAQTSRARIAATHYDIDVDLTPKAHRMQARVQVQFTALDDVSIATFELHNSLRVTRVLDARGSVLTSERVLSENAVRVPLNDTLAKGQSTSLTFEYEGQLHTGEDSPVPGLKLASIGEDVTYLLYAARWFPVTGYGVNRFTASMDVITPTGMTVIASGAGKQAPPKAAAPVEEPAPAAKGKKKAAPKKTAAPADPRLPVTAGKTRHSFYWGKANFPGTIIAGTFTETPVVAGGARIRVLFTQASQPQAQTYADAAAKAFDFYTGIYGEAPSANLTLVELPDDTLPTAWAPEIAALSKRAITEKVNYRLVANTIARQWWGASVAPARLSDFWITEGGARYSELRYVEHVAGPSAFEEAAKDLAVGALAYDNIPLSSVGTLDPFSPEFQSLVTDKGAMIFHMMRWVVGDGPFDRIAQAITTQYAGKSVSTDDFRKTAEQITGEQLTWFFAQWIDSTGAPEFSNKYTVYRTNKGFRVVGQISQDLDLFRMPMEIRVDTDGQSELKRIEVVGTESPYTVETFGRPRRIAIDPNNRVLKNSGELKVRVNILRGQQLVQQGDFAEALKEYNKALEVNRNSSLAHYRIAEVFFLQRNYQASANAYRASMDGDGEPGWTEVWSHIQLGKIFDITGQRERAVSEYRRAIQTGDNTQGAQDEAQKYIQAPYQRPAGE